MLLNNKQLIELSDLACQAARAAGQMISDYQGKSIHSQRKSQGGQSLASQVVTEIDLKSEKIIKSFLAESCQKYDLALLSEESLDDKLRLEKDYFWCIDPLDGTLFFIEGEPGYAVSIALVNKAGGPEIGVVYDVAKQILYHSYGAKVFVNSIERTFATNSPVKDTDLYFIFDKSFQDFVLFDEIIGELTLLAKELGYKGLVKRNQGGAVLNACWVLEHGHAVYFKMAKKEPGGGSLWDFAATASFFTSARAFVSDIHCDPLDLNRTDSTFMNHKGVLFTTEKNVAEGVSRLVTRLTS